MCKTKPAAHYTAGVLQISENTIQQSEIRSRPDKFRHGRNILESAFQFLGVNGNPVGQTVGLGQFQGFGDANLILSLLTDGDNITGLNGVGRNIYLVAVNADSAVGNELTCFSTCAAEAHTIDNVV